MARIAPSIGAYAQYDFLPKPTLSYLEYSTRLKRGAPMLAWKMLEYTSVGR